MNRTVIVAGCATQPAFPSHWSKPATRTATGPLEIAGIGIYCRPGALTGRLFEQASRRFCLGLILSALAFLLVAEVRAAVSSDPAPRPNILFVLMDDLRWDEVGCGGQPFAQTPNIDRIAREGAQFRNAFVTTPLCSPSRASYLTGRYAHSHGIFDNVDRSALSHQLKTFPQLIHNSGYETGFIGKWHMGVDDSPRPGFDYWVSVKGQGLYFDPDINEDGKSLKVPGYVTDVFTDRAVGFIKRTRTKPFLLYLAEKAVHPNLIQNADGSLTIPPNGGFTPAERHKTMFADKPIVRRPNARGGPIGKPALQRKIDDLPPLGPETGTDDETVRNRQRMVLAVDEGVGKILAALQQIGQLDNTVIMFTSDQGYFLGEHGLSQERRLAYEESIHIPMLVRYPRLVRAGLQIDPVALNLDVAPTLLELAGLPAPADLHGRSLVPLLKGESPAWRNSFLIEYFTDKVFPRVLNMGYEAVRTDHWKYIHYLELTGMDELYDLKADPYEMTNLIAEPAAQKPLGEMKEELQRLLKQTQAGPR